MCPTMDTRVDDGCTELCPEADRQPRPTSHAEDSGRHQAPPAQVQALGSRWDWTPANLPHGAKVHRADGMGLDTGLPSTQVQSPPRRWGWTQGYAQSSPGGG